MTFPSYQVPDHLYFVTATTRGWKHLFALETYASIVLNSLAWLRRENRMRLFAFVLLPSHLHTLVKPENDTIGELLQDFGSYASHAILEQLIKDRRDDLIQFFHEQRRDIRHQHSIWDDIQAKNVYSMKFLNQKLEYIHQNPVSKQWKLVAERGDYRYSSACFYDRGETSCIEVDDLRLWLSGDENNLQIQTKDSG